MSAKYKSPSFLLPNELNTSANPLNTDGNPATGTGINSLYSMNFDSANLDHINLGIISEINGLTNFSFSIWMKPKFGNPLEGKLVFGNRSSSSPNGVALALGNRVTKNSYFYVVSATGTLYLDLGANIWTENAWHHFVVTYDGSQLIAYINNGSPIIGNVSGATLSSTTPFYIGRESTAGSQHMRGQLDEFAIFNRALDATERAALYDGTGSNIRPSNLMATNLGPLAYYPLGEQAQNSGYPSATGNEWQFPNGVLQDYVMDFDGNTVGDYIDAGDIPLEGIYTISFWINPDASPSSLYFLLDKGDGGSNISARVTQTDINKIRFQIGSSNFSSTDTLTNNSWNNVILIANGSSSKIYINNGTATTGALTTASNTTQSLFIGTDVGKQSTYYFNGQMSNIVVWNSDQSANIANIYNNGSPQTSYTVTPQNWWKLNADSVYTPSAPNYTTALNFNSAKSDIDYVQFGNTSLSLPASLSIWLKPLGVPVNGYGMPYSDSSGQIYWATGPGGMKYEVTLAGAARVDSTVTLTADIGGWDHLVVTFTSTATKIYLNGELNKSGSGGTGTNFGQDINIGRWRGAATNILYSFDGSISNFAIFNSELSASQVSTLFNFGTPETNISLSPIHNWKLDNLTTGLNDTGSLASNNGTAGSVNGTGPVQESTPVAVVPSWKIPSELPIPTVNYTSALNFDGNDYISMSGVTLSNDFAFSLWFYTASSSALMFFLGDSASFNWCRINNGVFDVKFNGLQLTENTSINDPKPDPTFTIPANQWNNVILVKDSNNLIQVYFNGQVDPNYTPKGVGSPSANNRNQPFSPIFIGRRMSSYFTGKLSNTSMWNNALTASQVSTIFNNGSPEVALSFSPVHWWKLNEGGSTITDYAGSSNGTNNGATKVDSNVYVGNVPVNGVSTTLPSTALQQSDLQFDSPYSNYSLYFDAVSDRISIPYVLPSGTTKFSVSIWGNISAMTGSVNKCLIAQQPTGGLTSEGFSIFTDGAYPNTNVWFKIENNTGTQTTSNIVIGEWFHILATYDSGTAKIYFNGILENTTTGITSPLTTANTTETIIGSLNPSGITIPMLGYLDETAIWDTVALTEAQVLEIYNNGRPGDLDNFSGTAPISWWRLGENAYFNTGTTPGPEFTVPNSIAGAPNGVGSGTIAATISAYAPGTYANGIGDGLAITDRLGEAPLSVANSQSYNMIPDDKVPYVPGYVGAQTNNAFEMTFDGTNYFSLGSSIDLGQTNTISFWVYYPANGFHIVTGDPGISNSYNIFLNNGNSILYRTTTGYNTWNVTPTLNAWTHLVFTKNDTDTYGKLYFNGVKQSIGSGSGNIRYGFTKFNTIGAKPDGTSGFVGKLDEFAAWDKELTADQIKFDLYEPTALVGGVKKTADIENNTNLPTPVAWYRMGD